MEWKIGEIKQVNGEWYQCVKAILTCSSCEIPRPCTKIRELGYCSPNMRNDKEQVVFKKLEKVGEPYTHYCPSGRIIYFQRYKLFYKLYSHNTEYIMCDFNEDGIVSIEIKQNKEDMEERELDPHMEKVIDEATQKMGEEIGRQIEANLNKQRMKPFNLEAAKAGRPVCTRDGRKARIICFDAKGEQPIIALFEKERADEEIIQTYNVDGSYYKFKKDHRDLMMLPEKKEGWVNVYPDDCMGEKRYSTKEEASRYSRSNVIDTIKISWEE